MSDYDPPPDEFDEFEEPPPGYGPRHPRRRRPGPYDYDPYRDYEPERGTMILVFGILGLVCCFIFGAVAWGMANNDLRKMDRGIMDPIGRSNTQAGKVCGMISVILAIVVIGIVLLVILSAGAAFVTA